MNMKLASLEPDLPIEPCERMTFMAIAPDDRNVTLRFQFRLLKTDDRCVVANKLKDILDGNTRQFDFAVSPIESSRDYDFGRNSSGKAFTGSHVLLSDT